jgi:hypothetical protein
MTVTRTSRILVVVAVVASLACISAMARDTPNRPPGQGHAYLKSDIWKGVSGRIVPLPSPGDSGGLDRTSTVSGPVSIGVSRSSSPSLDAAPRGSAIPMGSDTFMTPMDRTKVQIQRLIRKLG